MKATTASMVVGLALLALASRATPALQTVPRSGSQVHVAIVSLTDCCPAEAWPEAEEKTRAELTALGLRVRLVPGAATREWERRKELELVSSELEAACALRILRPPQGSGGGIDLWLTDRLTNKTIYRHLPVEPGGGPEAAAVTALRAVEVLRASLLELRLIERQRPQAVSAPPELIRVVQEIEPPSERKLGLRFGLGGLWSKGGLGPQGALDVSLSWAVIPSLSLEIEGLLSMLGQPLSQGGSGASFDFALVRSWLFWELLPGRRLRPSLGIGGGSMIAWSEGVGSPVYELQEDQTAAAYLGGSGRLAWALSDALWIRGGVRAGFTLPEITVYFANQVAAAFGRPLLEGFIEFELKLL